MFGAPKEYPFSQSHIFAVFERILLDSLHPYPNHWITGAVKFSRAFPATTTTALKQETTCTAASRAEVNLLIACNCRQPAWFVPATAHERT
jgi:hypothetical protein